MRSVELKDLTAYADEQYRIKEEHKWADFPGFSVLCHPDTGKWVALLMRQWDGETGTLIERCDLKCGSEPLSGPRKPFITAPVRMHGSSWIGISFDERTEPEIIFGLFDQAIRAGKPHGYTLVLDDRPAADKNVYQETALPFGGKDRPPAKDQPPERLRKMRRLYEYGRESAESRAKNFYRQAVFMQDYEDDCPASIGEFICYYPTYQDMTTRQLRAYFTWRTRVRRGDYQPIAASAAYIYIYELLNGIGAASPEESFGKLLEFDEKFLGAGLGDKRMRVNLRKWMFEFAVVRSLPPELAERAFDQTLLEQDKALAVLKVPGEHTDEEVFEALSRFSGRKMKTSPVLTADPARGMHLFAEAWRAAVSYTREGRDLFSLCFGRMQKREFHPLMSAVFYEPERQTDREYALTPCRIFRLQNGSWQTESYEKLLFNKNLLAGFLHEADARLRRYLKTGKYLRENEADAWAIPYIDGVIEEEMKALIEAARPKITIDLSGLDKIRRDALTTRDSLLIGDEADYEEAPVAALPPAEEPAEDEAPAPAVLPSEEAETNDGPLDRVQKEILRALLAGQDAGDIIRENYLMPSLAADAINEAMMDEIGDTVLISEGDTLILVEDYIEDIRQYLGGT